MTDCLFCNLKFDIFDAMVFSAWLSCTMLEVGNLVEWKSRFQKTTNSSEPQYQFVVYGKELKFYIK